MDSGEEMGVVVKAMGINLTSHTPNMDIGRGETPTATEIGWFEG